MKKFNGGAGKATCCFALQLSAVARQSRTIRFPPFNTEYLMARFSTDVSVKFLSNTCEVHVRLHFFSV